MSDRKPWEQREGEPDRDYSRFLAYLELGPTRGLRQAGKDGEVTAERRQLERLSSEWDWVARASAWDQDQARKRLQRIEETRAKAMDRLCDGLLDVIDAHLKVAMMEVEASGPQVNAQKSVLAANGIDSSSKSIRVNGGDGAVDAISRAASALGATPAELADRYRRRAEQESRRVPGEGDG